MKAVVGSSQPNSIRYLGGVEGAVVASEASNRVRIRCSSPMKLFYGTG